MDLKLGATWVMKVPDETPDDERMARLAAIIGRFHVAERALKAAQEEFKIAKFEAENVTQEVMRRIPKSKPEIDMHSRLGWARGILKLAGMNGLTIRELVSASRAEHTWISYPYATQMLIALLKAGHAERINRGLYRTKDVTLVKAEPAVEKPMSGEEMLAQHREKENAERTERRNRAEELLKSKVAIDISELQEVLGATSREEVAKALTKLGWTSHDEETWLAPMVVDAVIGSKVHTDECRHWRGEGGCDCGGARMVSQPL